MNLSTSFFLSKVMYKNIYNISGSIIGKLNDFIVELDAEKPVFKAIEVKNGRRLFYVSAVALEVYRDDYGRYSVKLNTGSIQMMSQTEHEVYLVKDFLDKQIVDINGRKVERVNDVQVGRIHGKWNVIAVDIGLRGLLRRLDMEYLVIRFCSLFRVEFRNRLIYWNNVQPLATGAANLQLSTPMDKLKTLHAADIADILEELDKQTQVTVFQSLGDQRAAEVLKEVGHDVQLNLLETLTDEQASDILEIMPSDEAADILEEVEDTRVEKLLVQMETENSSEIRELMEYDERTIGSMMAKDFVTFPPNVTVETALTHLRANRPEDDAGPYIYLINHSNRLLGVISLIDLITADSTSKLLEELMTSNVLYYVGDEDKIDKAMKMMHKYNLPALPVLDNHQKLVGVTSLNDLLNEYIRLGRFIA
jgi:magnesium transporter